MKSRKSNAAPHKRKLSLR